VLVANADFFPTVAATHPYLVSMGPRNLPFMLMAAGLVAAAAFARKAPASAVQGPGPDDASEVPHRFVLTNDVPSLDLRRGEQLRVEPNALIRLGDVVALKNEQHEVVLTRFHDELMHCVAGLVIRERQTLSAS
jgi:hypothetical protein